MTDWEDALREFGPDINIAAIKKIEGILGIWVAEHCNTDPSGNFEIPEHIVRIFSIINKWRDA